MTKYTQITYNAHFHKGSQQPCNEIWKAWESGEQRVVAATSAFGMEIEQPDVRTATHVDPICQLWNYL